MKMYIKNLMFGFKICCLVLFLTMPNMALAKSIGHMSYVRGVASATSENNQFRLLNRGAELFQGDRIQTGRDSLAVLKFIDGSKISLRPHSIFEVEEYRFKNAIDNTDTGIFSLIKGGFRAISGFLSKNNPNAVKVNTLTATIGIRGTEFDVRYCDASECNTAPNKTIKKINSRPKTSQVVGRIAFKRGQLIAINQVKNNSRQIDRGGPIYEGDRLITSPGAFAVVAFTDHSRLTLTSDSQLLIEQYQYKPEQKKNNFSIFNLLKGGLRAVTGAIAKINKDQVKFKTVMATIGVRGTGFDIICQGSCENSSSIANPALRVNVWDGNIVLLQPGRETNISAGQTANIKGRLLAPKLAPLQKDNFSEPKPSDVDVDFDQLFGVTEMSQAQPDEGLYVTVYDGHVSVKGEEGRQIDLGAGEAAYAGVGLKAQRLKQLPSFQINDDTPAPDDINVKVENILNLVGEEQSYNAQSLECRIN